MTISINAARLQEAERALRLSQDFATVRKGVLDTQKQLGSRVNDETNFRVRAYPDKFTCWCLSRITHWRKRSKSDRTVCCVVGCRSHTELQGAIVTIGDLRGPDDWYVAPFCVTCANAFAGRDEEIWLTPETTLVSANSEKTCRGAWPSNWPAIRK